MGVVDGFGGGVVAGAVVVGLAGSGVVVGVRGGGVEVGVVGVVVGRCVLGCGCFGNRGGQKMPHGIGALPGTLIVTRIDSCNVAVGCDPVVVVSGAGVVLGGSVVELSGSVLEFGGSAAGSDGSVAAASTVVSPTLMLDPAPSGMSPSGVLPGGMSSSATSTWTGVPPVL